MEGRVLETGEFRTDKCRVVRSVCLSLKAVRYQPVVRIRSRQRLSSTVGKHSLIFHCHLAATQKSHTGTRKHSVLTSQGLEYPGQNLLPALLRLLDLKCLRSSVSMQVPLVRFSSSMWRQPGRGLLLNLRYRSLSETRTTSRELPGYLKLRPYCCELRL